MISIGNNKISEIYVGSTKIKEVYVGSTKVFPSTPSVVWHDDEFKSKVLTTLGLDDNATLEELAAITDTQFASVSLLNNTTVKTIADLAKFTSVTKIPTNCFAGCTSLGTDNTVQDGTTLNIPTNIVEIGNYAFMNCSGYKSFTIDHVVTCSAYGGLPNNGCFSGMNNLEGVINLSNLRNITQYHEFDGWGRNGSGIKVIMPTEQSVFGVWFAGAKLTAMADSEANLEDNVIKIPNNYTEGFTYAFGATYFSGINNKYVLEGARYVNSIIGGDNSSTACSQIVFGENCIAISGPCLSDNEGNYSIVCKSTTPPTLGLGGIGFDNGSDVAISDNVTVKSSEAVYPFMYTSRVTAIYVPDDVVDTYKADTKWCVMFGTNTLASGEGSVNCNGTSTPDAAWPSYGGDYTIEERVIGWSRFADKIKPMSELS